MKTKRDLIDHLLTILDDTKSSLREDLIIANKTSLKMIAELEILIYLSQEKSTNNIKQPDFSQLEEELNMIKQRFYTANIKKETMQQIRSWGHMIIDSLEDDE
jgi:hypothetical protein